MHDDTKIYEIAGHAIDRWYDDPDPQLLQTHVEDLVQEFNITAAELWPAVAVLLAELALEEAIHRAAAESHQENP